MKTTIVCICILMFYSANSVSSEYIPEIIIDKKALSIPIENLDFTNGPAWYSIRDIRLGQSGNSIKQKYPSKNITFDGYSQIMMISNEKNNKHGIGFATYDDNGSVGLGPVTSILLEQMLGPARLDNSCKDQTKDIKKKLISKYGSPSGISEEGSPIRYTWEGSTKKMVRYGTSTLKAEIFCKDVIVLGLKAESKYIATIVSEINNKNINLKKDKEREERMKQVKTKEADF